MNEYITMLSMLFGIVIVIGLAFIIILWLAEKVLN